MAPRKKDPAKPLLATKFDFFESVDALIQSAIMLDQSVGMMLDLAKKTGDGDLILSKPTVELLKERAAHFRAALFTEDGQG